MNSTSPSHDAPSVYTPSPRNDPKMIDRIPSLVSLSSAASDGNSDCDDSEQQMVARGGVVTPFPWKLHDMLERIEEDGYAHVVSWQPHGRCFVVHNPTKFVTEVMPIYFNQTKFASFQRQLNLYGFSRLTTGRDKGGYHHDSFLRGMRQLCQNMTRQKVKGTKVRRALEPALEPQFYSMPYMAKKIDGDKEQVPSTTTACQPSQVDKKPDVVCFFEGKQFFFFDESMVMEPAKCDASSLKRENTVIQTWMTAI